MPRKSFKDLRFRTADQIKLNTKRLKCKICGKKVKGKSTLSRHISHAHSDLSPVKREKMVIDEYFGQSKVNDAIKKYKAGIYNLSTIPIDISRYIRLAEIEPDEYEEVKKKTQDNEKETEKEKISVSENFDVIAVKDANAAKDAPIEFIDDMFFSFEDGKLKCSLTQSLENALPYELAKQFTTKLKLQDSIIYISKGEHDYPIEKVDKRKEEEKEKSEDRVICTVTYSGNSEKKKEE